MSKRMILRRKNIPRLMVAQQPPPEFYKDEGGKSHHMVVRVELQGINDAEFPIPLKVKLHYESHDVVEDRDQGILKLMENEFEPPTLRPGSLSTEIKFRLEKVSRRKDGQRFCLRVDANSDLCEEDVSDIQGCFTDPICVLSKRKNHLRYAGSDRDSEDGRAQRSSGSRRASTGSGGTAAAAAVAADLRNLEASVHRKLDAMNARVASYGTQLANQMRMLGDMQAMMAAMMERFGHTPVPSSSPLAAIPPGAVAGSPGLSGPPSGYAEAAKVAGPTKGVSAAGASFAAAAAAAAPRTRAQKARRGRRGRGRGDDDAEGEDAEMETAAAEAASEGDEAGQGEGADARSRKRRRRQGEDDTSSLLVSAAAMVTAPGAVTSLSSPLTASVATMATAPVSAPGTSITADLEAASTLSAFGGIHRANSREAMTRGLSYDLLGASVADLHHQTSQDSIMGRGISEDLRALGDLVPLGAMRGMSSELEAFTT
mmetsp:Transcript_27169/g.87327  ORF Transcript_27169/g.87327 Transcript_27169/m.87327 type:complete len:485 (-) Transcript_27169:100-1554(-)